LLQRIDAMIEEDRVSRVHLRVPQKEGKTSGHARSQGADLFDGAVELEVEAPDSAKDGAVAAAGIVEAPESVVEPAPEERKIASPEVSRGEDRKSSSDSLANRLLRALDRAESTPGWNFVSLKKFRDEILPSEPFSPGAFQPADVHWQDAIRSAIEKRLILVGKVPNPKSPQFPVTSIRLNRLMPEVQEVLGLPKRDLDFHPIHIKGEPLSATILRERR
jgi:hypothetical protein